MTFLNISHFVALGLGSREWYQNDTTSWAVGSSFRLMHLEGYWLWLCKPDKDVKKELEFVTTVSYWWNVKLVSSPIAWSYGLPVDLVRLITKKQVMRTFYKRLPRLTWLNNSMICLVRNKLLPCANFYVEKLNSYVTKGPKIRSPICVSVCRMASDILVVAFCILLNIYDLIGLEISR